MDQLKGDRLGLVLAFWGLGLVLGRPLVSQTDYREDGSTFGEFRPGISSCNGPICKPPCETRVRQLMYVFGLSN